MPKEPLLELVGVTKRFGRVTVADGLSLAVAPDETLGMVGPNGAGKTSVFGLISGDLAADSGRVLFSGRDVTRLDAAARCRLGIGRTYQVPRPFEQMTVFENVLVGANSGAGLKRRAAFELTVSILTETALLPEANRPAGSLGLLQRKRLELARALATRPRVLLLDEVAAGLTDPEVRQLIEIVQRLAERAREEHGLAVVWIEHVVRALAPTVDRLVCLDSGSVIADGDPDEVLSDPRVKEVYLGTATFATAGSGASGQVTDMVGSPSRTAGPRVSPSGTQVGR